MGRKGKGGSIYQRPDSAIWWASYVDANGRRRRVSTEQTDAQSARIYLATLLQAEREGHTGRLTESRMREHLKEITERMTGETVLEYTVRSWLDGWLVVKKSRCAPGGYTRYKGVVTAFLAFLGKRADMRLENLSPKDVQGFVNLSHKKKKQGKTIGFEKKTLSSAFSKAVQLKKMDSDPTATVEIPAGGASVKRVAFSPDEVASIIAVADVEWRALIAIAYYSGLRLGDGSNLKWQDVDLSGSFFSFIPEKTRFAALRRHEEPPPLIVPIHSALLPYLLELSASDDPHAFLFPSLAGRSTSGRAGLSYEFIKLMEDKAKIAGKRSQDAEVTESLGDEFKARSRRIKSFHSMRRSNITEMRKADVDLETRQKLVGHADTDMTLSYTDDALEKLRLEVEKLPPLPVIKSSSI
jgi:integrase